MGEVQTETHDGTTEQMAPTLTLAEQIRVGGDGSLSVDETAIETLISEASAFLVKGLPAVRTVRGVYAAAASFKLQLAESVVTKNGHPDWGMRSGAFKILWQAVQARTAESMDVKERPTDAEWDTYNAGIRQAIMRGQRDEAIVAYVSRTKNGAAEMDKSSAPFKRYVREEYNAANLTIPKDWRIEGDTTGSGTGGGPERDSQTDAYTAAVSGVDGLYNAENGGGVNHHLHAAALLKSIVLFGQRVLKGGEITDRDETGQLLLSGEALLEIINQAVGAPDKFGEGEADKLREELKLAEVLVESARK